MITTNQILKKFMHMLLDMLFVKPWNTNRCCLCTRHPTYSGRSTHFWDSRVPANSLLSLLCPQQSIHSCNSLSQPHRHWTWKSWIIYCACTNHGCIDLICNKKWNINYFSCHGFLFVIIYLTRFNKYSHNCNNRLMPLPLVPQICVSKLGRLCFS